MTDGKMTDKQIIINDCDVSGCDELVNECDCYLTQEHDYWATNPYTYNKCSGFPNCYYKQLKRKEQECEELKEVNTELEVDLQNARDSYVALDLMRVGEYNALVDDYNKLKQTLTEIKEIAERCIKGGALTSDFLQILQKISEVENE